MWDIISTGSFPKREGQQFTRFIPMFIVCVSDPSCPYISVVPEQRGQFFSLNPKIYCYRMREGFFYAWILGLQPSLTGFKRRLAYFSTVPTPFESANLACHIYAFPTMSMEKCPLSLSVNILAIAKEK